MDVSTLSAAILGVDVVARWLNRDPYLHNRFHTGTHREPRRM